MAEASFDGAIQIVNTPTITGYDIVETKGLVWASSVKAAFILKDLIALVRIILGGEVHEYRHLINETRHEILKKLNHNAKKVGANAIVNVRLTTSQVIPGTVELLGFGTAVVVKKQE